MFRVTQHVIQNRALLLRRKPVDLQVLSISRTHNPLLYKYKKAYEQERDPCPPPPPPEAPPPRDDRLLWGTVAALVVMGSFAVYAKQSPEIRDWLTIHAPWFDDIIAIMYQENQTYMEFLCNSSADIKKYVTDFMKPNPCDDDGAEELVVKKISCDESGKEEEEEDIEAIEEEEVEEEEPSPCDSLPPPIAAKDICDYEACLREVGDTTVDNYMVARDASQCYNRIVAGVMRKFSYVEMKKLEEDLAEKNELVEQSIAKATQAEKQFKNLQRYFVCAMDVPKEKCENTKQLFKEYQDRITIMKNEYVWENEMAQTYDELRKKVDSVVSKYAFQNEAVYSGLDYNTPRPMLKTGEPDFLLVNTIRYIKKLRTAAKDEMDTMSARISRAFHHLPQGEKITAERDKALQALFSKRKHDNERIFNTRLEDLKSDYAKETQANLDKLAKKHAELVVAKLKRKEEEANEKMDEIVAEKVAVEKHKFDTQLREMALKLKVIQAKLNERLKGEQESNRSKALYNAGAALLAATKKGEPTIKVDKELQAIDNASGDNDKLVATVLHSIPQSVWEKGIVPESVLRRNYHSMEKVALEVALVEQEGSPLPLYWLSWLQSTLLFMKLSSIPQAEIDNPPKADDIKGLDTFDLLQRARFWVERGNLSAALRYVSALEGASRAAAATWHRDAQAHCEVKQAAEAVLAHAAALGLRWL